MKISELYRGCRTYRKFLQEPVSREDMREILDVARLRSCAGNRQDLRFHAVMSEELKEKVKPLMFYAGRLPREIGTPKENEHPVAFVVITGPKNPSVFNEVDAGIAADAMAITAWEKGIGSIIFKTFKAEELGNIIHMPEDRYILLVMGFGKPAHRSSLVEPGEDGSIAYYVDEELNYYVPKRPFEDVAEIL